MLYSDGTVRPSNIVSLKKNDEDDDSEITYENVKIDTDGDGLEDGYEIWDFKTKWNEKKSEAHTIRIQTEMDSQMAMK